MLFHGPSRGPGRCEGSRGNRPLESQGQWRCPGEESWLEGRTSSGLEFYYKLHRVYFYWISGVINSFPENTFSDRQIWRKSADPPVCNWLAREQRCWEARARRLEVAHASSLLRFSSEQLLICLWKCAPSWCAIWKFWYFPVCFVREYLDGLRSKCCLMVEWGVKSLPLCSLKTNHCTDQNSRKHFLYWFFHFGDLNQEPALEGGK